MGRASRTKGNSGELEVRRLYEAHGFTVRGLEGAGDHLALGHGLTIFSEVKRAERWCVQEWLRQTWRECPEGALPVLAFRGNRWPWVAAVPLDALLTSLAPVSDTRRPPSNVARARPALTEPDRGASGGIGART